MGRKHVFAFVMILLLVGFTSGISNLCALGNIPSSCSLSASSLKYAAPPASYTLTGTATASINKTGDWASFIANSIVMLIQIQGCTYDASTDYRFGNGGVTNGTGLLTLNSGLHEFRQIMSATPAATTVALVLDKAVVNSYVNSATSTFQLVLVPFCDTIIINADLTVPSWNGATGGVLALFAKTLQLNAAIFADGAGFRGAPSTNGTDVHDQANIYAAVLGGSSRGYKGEGVCGGPSGLPKYIRYTSGLDCDRGAPGNAGGGASGRDVGGGGGANAGDGGNGGGFKAAGNPGGDLGLGIRGSKLTFAASPMRLFFGRYHFINRYF